MTERENQFLFVWSIGWLRQFLNFLTIDQKSVSEMEEFKMEKNLI